MQISDFPDYINKTKDKAFETCFYCIKKPRNSRVAFFVLENEIFCGKLSFFGRDTIKRYMRFRSVDLNLR